MQCGGCRPDTRPIGSCSTDALLMTVADRRTARPWRGRRVTVVEVAAKRHLVVTARSKAWVWHRSLAGIAGSNPTGGMDVFCECCVLDLCVWQITRPKESYRVWCVWVWSLGRDNEEAPFHWWLSHQWGRCRIMKNLMNTCKPVEHSTVHKLRTVTLSRSNPAIPTHRTAVIVQRCLRFCLHHFLFGLKRKNSYVCASWW